MVWWQPALCALNAFWLASVAQKPWHMFFAGTFAGIALLMVLVNLKDRGDR